MHQKDKLNVPTIKLSPVEEKLDGELSKEALCVCDFCTKQSHLRSHVRGLCDVLSGDDKFYCTFCLRHRFNTKIQRDILVMSFRAIIGYYYHALYKEKAKLAFSQVSDFVRSHAQTGVQNPLFFYDPESMLWFVDFSRVGRGKKKIKLRYVLETVVNILACFNFVDNIEDANMHKFYERFEEAIKKFHSHRYRPEDRRILIPTLSGCLTVLGKQKPFNFEATRNFTPGRFAVLR